MRFRAFWFVVAVCACKFGVSGTALAQPADVPPPAPTPLPSLYLPPPDGPRVALPLGSPGGFYSYPGFVGWPYLGYWEPLSPRVAVGAGYGYPWWYGYSGRAGSYWSNGLSLYGPPVPVPGSLPGVLGNDDLVRQWRSTLYPGFAGYGWVGISVAPRAPIVYGPSVPTVEALPPGPAAPLPPGAKAGGSLMLSVRVPQPAAEVFVNGKRTGQTGTDRIYQSPPLEAGEKYTYVVTVRWLERGQTVEMTKQASGTPGEVVRLDFGR